MKKKLAILILFFLIAIRAISEATSVELIPVNDQGRYRPLGVYSKLFLRDLYHLDAIRHDDLKPFSLSREDALSFFLTLHFLDSSPFISLPLFYIESKELRNALQMEGKTRISYLDIRENEPFLDTLSNEALSEWKALIQKIRSFEKGGDFYSIPLRYRPTEWVDIKKLLSENHFSFFPEPVEEKLQSALTRWIQSPTIEEGEAFAKAYFEGYASLAGRSFSLSKDTQISFPSLLKLQIENEYYKWPLIPISIALYLMSILFFLIAVGFQKKIFPRLAWICFGLAFFLHTLSLLIRMYILGRPPVSNMAETLIYVPWIISLAGAILSLKFSSPFLRAAAISLSITLLSLLEWCFGSQALENVQPVLNSQLWLTIHVLMVVGSYGALLLSGFLAHFYLLQRNRDKLLEQAILQLMYVGIALLIPGTLLGGVWAAQSWGRFWDWDPKESWAFISICFYILSIHAYRFRIIEGGGLALCAVCGLVAISFTWYGVNYILGTGLHSYGFGSGGEWLYYAFIIFEALFIALVGWVNALRGSSKGEILQRL